MKTSGESVGNNHSKAKKKKKESVCKAGSRCIRVSLCFQIGYHMYIQLCFQVNPAERALLSSASYLHRCQVISLSLSLSRGEREGGSHTRTCRRSGSERWCWCDPAPWLGCFSGPRPRLVVIRNRRRFKYFISSRLTSLHRVLEDGPVS